MGLQQYLVSSSYHGLSLGLQENDKKSRGRMSLKDKSLKWLRMSEADIKKDFARHSPAELKIAGASLFKLNDKRLKSRKYIEERLLYRIRELKALIRLGS